jgi:hypothetical protein
MADALFQERDLREASEPNLLINRNPNIASRNRKDFVDAVAFFAAVLLIISMH